MKRTTPLRRFHPLAKTGKQKPKRRERYRAFLASAKWKRIREAALKRAGYQCELCGGTEDLQVHHVSYRRFGGDELPEDLAVLDKRCHEGEHAKEWWKQGRR